MYFEVFLFYGPERPQEVVDWCAHKVVVNIVTEGGAVLNDILGEAERVRHTRHFASWVVRPWKHTLIIVGV